MFSHKDYLTLLKELRQHLRAGCSGNDLFGAIQHLGQHMQDTRLTLKSDIYEACSEKDANGGDPNMSWHTLLNLTLPTERKKESLALLKEVKHYISINNDSDQSILLEAIHSIGHHDYTLAAREDLADALVDSYGDAIMHCFGETFGAGSYLMILNLEQQMESDIYQIKRRDSVWRGKE